MKKHWKILIAILLALTTFVVWHSLTYWPFYRTMRQTFFQTAPDADKSLLEYYQEGQQLAAEQQPTTQAVFLAVGDIMLSRNVAAAIGQSKNPLLPFGNMAADLKSTDFNFGNLESPFAASNQSAIIGGHSLDFAAPPQNIEGLSQNNFQILNLANNHAFDQGLKGLEFTRQYLDANRIQHVGTGDSLTEAWQPAVVAANGLKICFLGASYASSNDGGKTSNPYVARIEDRQNLQFAINQAKTLCDFVVVSMHAGTEYNRSPNQAQINFAHLAIDDGADLVVGAHPHWVQTIEKYKARYIFYSLGNFIFDQNWSQETREGLVLKIQVSKAQTANPLTTQAANLDDLQGNRTSASLDSIMLIPIIIDNYATPRLANDKESQEILEKIGESEKILK